MDISTGGSGPTRARLGWWAFVCALGVAFAYVLYSFVGTFVLGVFAYYATRPVYRRVRPYLSSDSRAAVATSLGVFVPLVLFFTYAGFAITGELLGPDSPLAVQQLVSRLLDVELVENAQGDLLVAIAEEPVRVLSSRRQAILDLLSSGAQFLQLAGLWLLHVGLALTLAFYLLRDDDTLGQLYRKTVGGEETTAYAYATAVDRDLEYIFFGNVIFVAVVGILAAVIYTALGLVSPEGVSIPLPVVLAALTGISSLIPIVVTKVVYVPLVAYLAYQASQTDASMFFPTVVLVVAFFTLDIFPQMVLQPYITGRKITMGLMLFGYLLGPLLFGWYGIFLLPILLVLGIQAIRIVVEELVHGEPLTPRVQVEEGLGSDPTTESPEADPDVDE